MNLLQIMIIAAIMAIASSFSSMETVVRLGLRIITVYAITTFFITMNSPSYDDNNIYARKRNN